MFCFQKFEASSVNNYLPRLPRRRLPVFRLPRLSHVRPPYIAYEPGMESAPKHSPPMVLFFHQHQWFAYTASRITRIPPLDPFHNMQMHGVYNIIKVFTRTSAPWLECLIEGYYVRHWPIKCTALDSSVTVTETVQNAANKLIIHEISPRREKYPNFNVVWP